MISISVKQKVNPRDILAPRKYFGIAKATGVVNIRQLSNRISKETTLGTPDVMAVIEALLQDIPEFLLDGKIVKLGDFGSYRLTVRGKGTENLDDYSVNLIEKTNLHFRGGKVFKDVLSRAEFSKVS